jgi:hypothetical protein
MLQSTRRAVGSRGIQISDRRVHTLNTARPWPSRHLPGLLHATCPAQARRVSDRWTHGELGAVSTCTRQLQIAGLGSGDAAMPVRNWNREPRRSFVRARTRRCIQPPPYGHRPPRRLRHQNIIVSSRAVFSWADFDVQNLHSARLRIVVFRLYLWIFIQTLTN